MRHIQVVAFTLALLAGSVSLATAQSISPALQAQINQQAAQTPNSEAGEQQFAAFVASLVSANPTLADAIAGAATNVRPAAATSIAASLAPIVSSDKAAAVINAIANNVPADQKALIGSTLVTTYIGASPLQNQASLQQALTPLLVSFSLPAAGQQQGEQRNNNPPPSALLPTPAS